MHAHEYRCLLKAGISAAMHKRSWAGWSGPASNCWSVDEKRWSLGFAERAQTTNSIPSAATLFKNTREPWIRNSQAQVLLVNLHRRIKAERQFFYAYITLYPFIEKPKRETLVSVMLSVVNKVFSWVKVTFDTRYEWYFYLD